MWMGFKTGANATDRQVVFVPHLVALANGGSYAP